MSQRRSSPDVQTGCGPLVQSFARGPLRHFGAGQRHDHIQLRSASDDEADTAQNAVDLSIATKAVEVHGWQACRFSQQFLVCHFLSPINAPGHATINVRFLTLDFRFDAAIRASVAGPQQADVILSVVPRDGTASSAHRPRAIHGIGQTHHQRLDDVGQSRDRNCESSDNDSGSAVVAGEDHRPHDAVEQLHVVDTVEENLGRVLHVNQFDHIDPRRADNGTLARSVARVPLENFALIAAPQREYSSPVAVDRWHNPHSGARA